MDMPLNQFKRALAAGDTQIGLFLGLANAYAARGMFNEASVNYFKAVSLAPRYPYAYYNLAVMYAQTGEHEKARTCLRKVLELDASDKEARRMLESLPARY